MLVSQYIANTREMMDAANSDRWTDAFITTVLGIVSGREWSSLLGANTYYKFAMRNVTTDSDGKILYTALNSGSGKEEALDRKLQHRLQRVGGLNEIEIDHRIVIQQAAECCEKLREIALGKRVSETIGEREQ